MSHSLAQSDRGRGDPRQDERPIHAALEDRELTDKLRRFIRSNLHRRGIHYRNLEDETYETFQSVCAKALEKASTFNAQRGDVDVWIRRIAKNIMIDRFRKEQSRKVAYKDMVERPLTLGDPTETIFVPERPEVREVLASLSEKDQEVFRRSYEEALTGKELAKALGCKSPGAARVLVFRLRDDFTVGWARLVYRRVRSCAFAEKIEAIGSLLGVG